MISKNTIPGKIIYWTPRILSICSVIFLSLFSLDAFSGDSPVWEKLLGLLIHLVPVFILIGVVILAWKHELVGGILYIGLGILYIILVGLHRPLSWYLGITGPLVVIGILFLLSRFFVDKKTEDSSVQSEGNYLREKKE